MLLVSNCKNDDMLIFLINDINGLSNLGSSNENLRKMGYKICYCTRYIMHYLNTSDGIPYLAC